MSFPVLLGLVGAFLAWLVAGAALVQLGHAMKRLRLVLAFAGTVRNRREAMVSTRKSNPNPEGARLDG